MSKKPLVLHSTPRLWWRYVDDTFVIQKEVHKQDFLQHINSVDPAIQFTVENNKEDGAIPFLDTIVKPNKQGTTNIQPTTNEVKTKSHIVIPYTQGLCESIKKICGRYGIQTHFKGGNTIRNLLVSPKDKDPISKSGAIYWFQCGDLTCDDEYIGETSRLLEKGSKST